MNPREIMIVFWAVAGLLAAIIFIPKFRAHIPGLLKAFFAWKLMVLAVGGLAWNAAVLVGLYRIGYWSLDLWFDTAVFVTLGTFVLVWRMSDEKEFSRRFFVTAALTNIGIGVLLETMVSGYTFGYVAEFFLIPWLFVLGALQAVAQSQERFASVAKLVTFLIGATGFAMIAQAVVGAIGDAENFLTWATLRWLLLPFVLTAFFLPYLFLIRVVFTYGTAFAPVKHGTDRKWTVRAYARLRIMLRFRLNLAALEAFRSGRGNQLRWATSRAEVDAVFREQAQAAHT